MTVEDFAHILATEMQADHSTTLADTLLKRARASILAGGGDISSLLSSGINGKSFAKAVHLNAAQVIDACRRALNIYLNDGEDDTVVAASYADFSNINR